jgi:hypothetical protein
LHAAYRDALRPAYGRVEDVTFISWRGGRRRRGVCGRGCRGACGRRFVAARLVILCLGELCCATFSALRGFSIRNAPHIHSVSAMRATTVRTCAMIALGAVFTAVQT